MKKFFKYVGLMLLLLIIVLFAWFGKNLRDQHPDYKVDLKILNNPSTQLSAGFCALPITPAVPDRWDDKNKNAIHREYYVEKYAKDVGLVYREIKDLRASVVISGIPVEQRITSGVIYKLTYITHGYE